MPIETVIYRDRLFRMKIGLHRPQFPVTAAPWRGLLAAAAVLAAAVLLSACALTGSNRRIVAADGKPIPPEASAVLGSACAVEAETKTTGSVAGILRSLRPGSYQRAYAACVQTKGFNVEGAPPAAPTTTATASAPPASPTGAKPAPAAGTQAAAAKPAEKAATQ